MRIESYIVGIIVILFWIIDMYLFRKLQHAKQQMERIQTDCDRELDRIMKNQERVCKSCYYRSFRRDNWLKEVEKYDGK